MSMTYFWCLCAGASALWAVFCGKGGVFAAELLQGAANAIEVSVTIAGPLALWSGLNNLMDHLGITDLLSKAMSPILNRLFPSAKKDPGISRSISGNICANLLGLGNAATPLGIQAVRQLRAASGSDTATHEMCRLVVMNTASIQLIPTTVAAVRSAAGAQAPFDILPCVWSSSILSVTAGLIAAELFRRIPHDP